MTDQEQIEQSQNQNWYPGKNIEKAASATWKGTKAVAKAIKDNPGHAAIGVLVTLPLGPVGWVAGASTVAWIGKKNDPAQNEPEKSVDSDGKE